MCKLTDIYNHLKTIFPEAIETNKKDLNQSGIYLFFNGSANNNWREDRCSCSILVASESMNENENSILPLIDDIRGRTGSEAALAVFGIDIFNEITAGEFTDTLYVYNVNLSMPLYREMEDL